MFNWLKKFHTKNGDSMKDLITFLILLIVCMLIEEPTTQTVFDELENQDIVKNYYIEIDNLNTNNFKEYFNGLEVVALIPYINPVYKDRLVEFYMYDGIYNFRKKYINILKQNGYYQEANKYILRPIVIEKVLVNASLNDIYDTLNGKDYIIVGN